MDRRSFVISLFGGLAAASVGGAAMAKSVAQAPARLAMEGNLDAATSARLDKLDAEHNQVVVRETVVRRRPRPWRRRPVVVRKRVIVRRPRRVIVR